MTGGEVDWEGTIRYNACCVTAACNETAVLADFDDWLRDDVDLSLSLFPSASPGLPDEDDDRLPKNVRERAFFKDRTRDGFFIAVGVVGVGEEASLSLDSVSGVASSAVFSADCFRDSSGSKFL
jgi:hypothetical protein